jgi:hypothetical protein
MRGNRFLKIVKCLAIAVVIAAALSLVVMQLWNWLMPSLFAVHAITFWQALGILLLSKILFGGFRGRPGCGGGHWRGRMRRRWEAMTPEEREKFRASMGGHCGFRTPEPQPPGV